MAKKQDFSTSKKMGRPANKRLKNRVEIARAITESHGNVYLAARKLDVPRITLWNRIQADPELMQLMEDMRQSVLDVAESSLYSAIVDKQGWAVCFTLKTIGASRGYVEPQQRQYTETKEQQPLVIGGEASPDDLFPEAK